MKFWLIVRKKYYLLALLVLIPALLWASIEIFSEKPPVKMLENCRKLIAEARKKDAEKFSPKEFERAEKLWEQALTEWKLQNKKTVPFRNFDKVSKLSGESIKKAEESIRTAVKRKKALRDELEKDIASMKKISVQIETLCKKLPLNHGIRQNLTPANLKLAEAEAAFKRNDLLQSKKKIDTVKSTIQSLKNQTVEVLQDYFLDYDLWKKNNNEMIEWSKKNGSISLVIDKFSRKCIVYKSGEKIKEFDVELGINWFGNKQYRGDMGTPEGKYKIIKKKNGKDTKYHKALLLDFPNDEDKARFKRAKQKGLLQKSAQIGGLIEIHGGGGKGIDWTEGCVALGNSDMDKLFALCPTGTPIAIVGSLTNIDELFVF